MKNTSSLEKHIKLSKQLRFLLISIFFQFLFWSFGLSQNQFSIPQIQGESTISPLLNDQVTVDEVVITAIYRDILYVQSINEDGNPRSSEGIMVVWEDANDFEENNIVRITGVVRELDDNTAIQAQSITKIGENTSPLTPIIINDNFPGESLQSINPLEFAEGQLVSFTNIQITGPSIGSDLAYISGASTRPLREPGVEFPGIIGLPVWDGNPDVFFFVPDGLGLASNAFLHADMKITGTGIIVQEQFNYALYPITYIVSEEAAIPETNPAQNDEFNIGCLNVLFLEKEDSSYELRLQKIADYIQNVLQTPDVVALQEVGGEQEFEDLATLLSTQTGQEYIAMSVNPTGSINNGYLVRSTFTVQNLEALGTTQTFDGGSLHDRPPLLLDGFINTENGTKQLSILNLHQRSLSGITGNGSDFVRRKRNAQAISVAQMVRDLQDQEKQIVVVGDFNAYQFSDGFVDVVNQIAGTASLGAQFPVSPKGLEPLINVSANFPPEEERYSFVFRGNAQMLDHCLVSNSPSLEVSHFQFGRGNCDYPNSMLELDVPFRATDHDGFSVFLKMDSDLVMGDSRVFNEEEIFIPNPYRSVDEITFRISEKQNLTLELFNMAGQTMTMLSLGAIEDDSVMLPNIQNLSAGLYIIRISGRSIDYSEKLVIINN